MPIADAAYAIESELPRVADALERIAEALESLARRGADDDRP